MARWQIKGAEKFSGSDMEFIVDARSKEDALADAGKMGFLVESAQEVGDPHPKATGRAADYLPSRSDDEERRQARFEESGKSFDDHIDDLPEIDVAGTARLLLIFSQVSLGLGIMSAVIGCVTLFLSFSASAGDGAMSMREGGAALLFSGLGLILSSAVLKMLAGIGVLLFTISRK